MVRSPTAFGRVGVDGVGGLDRPVAADEVTQLPALITAPLDPVRLGAANRALERAGVPWRFGARRTGEANVRGVGFDGVTVTSRYDLVAQAGASAETLAVVGRDAWIVSGPKYTIIASPLREAEPGSRRCFDGRSPPASLHVARRHWRLYASSRTCV